MKISLKRFAFIAVLVAFVIVSSLALPRDSLAQTGGTYALTWSTVDGGGATFSTGGTYSLGGTVGQPDTGAMSGGTYSLGGGFWGLAASVANAVNQIFLPLILK